MDASCLNDVPTNPAGIGILIDGTVANEFSQADGIYGNCPCSSGITDEFIANCGNALPFAVMPPDAGIAGNCANPASLRIQSENGDCFQALPGFNNFFLYGFCDTCENNQLVTAWLVYNWRGEID